MRTEKLYNRRLFYSNTYFKDPKYRISHHPTEPQQKTDDGKSKTYLIDNLIHRTQEYSRYWVLGSMCLNLESALRLLKDNDATTLREWHLQDTRLLYHAH